MKKHYTGFIVTGVLLGSVALYITCFVYYSIMPQCATRTKAKYLFEKHSEIIENKVSKQGEYAFQTEISDQPSHYLKTITIQNAKDVVQFSMRCTFSSSKPYGWQNYNIKITRRKCRSLDETRMDLKTYAYVFELYEYFARTKLKQNYMEYVEKLIDKTYDEINYDKRVMGDQLKEIGMLFEVQQMYYTVERESDGLFTSEFSLGGVLLGRPSIFGRIL